MENNISSQTTNYIIVGNKEGLFFDPNSLQRYIAIQGTENSVNKPLLSENLLNFCPGNNNEKTNGEVVLCDNVSMPQSKFDAKCGVQKKPCPLEMSIKAADLDAEFNDSCLFVQDGSGQYIQLSEDRNVLNLNFKEGLNINLPKTNPLHDSIPFTANEGVEISIPENLDSMQVILQVDNNFQEVANNAAEGNDSNVQLSEIKTGSNKSLTNVLNPGTKPQPSFENKSVVKNTHTENKKMICKIIKKKHKLKEKEKSIPLVLKIRKVKHKIKRSKIVENFNDEEWESVKPRRKKSKLVKSAIREFSDWDSSDEETLDATSKRLHSNDIPVVKCCPRICTKKIQRSQQDAAYSYFTELEKLGQGDRYLGSCVHLKIISPTTGEPINDDEDIDTPLSPWPNYDQISEEIANESNGNQLISDEIKNAINESLKDQESSNNESVETKPKLVVEIIPKNPIESCENYNTLIWTYYIVAKNRQRPVCLKFLLKTLNIDEPRIEQVRKKILSGDDLNRIPVSPTRSKLCKSWDIASQHLESLPTKPVPYCRMSPPHLYFVKPIDRRTLYHKFCRYHQIVTGIENVPKIESYRRFLLVNSNIVFPRQKESSCAGCDLSKAPTEGKSPNLTNTLPNASDKRKRKKDDLSIQPSKLKLKKSMKMSKRKIVLKKAQRGDVFSLMLSHLNSLPAKIPSGCVLCERHKFFSPSDTTVQSLYEDYRRYFLKCTNSELGLRFAIYESFFLRNPLFAIAHLDENTTECPKCDNSVQNINSTDPTTAKK